MSKSVFIYSVSIVQGKTLRPTWRDLMQKIYTNKPGKCEFYIDEMPGEAHGQPIPGYDWVKHVGKEVDDVEISPDKDHPDQYQWLNKRV